jgi:hypothetical protein
MNQIHITMFSWVSLSLLFQEKGQVSNLQALAGTRLLILMPVTSVTAQFALHFRRYPSQAITAFRLWLSLDLKARALPFRHPGFMFTK